MNPRAVQAQSDNDSLQADVMRFMAIIAFCLIAILALVRNVEPPPTATRSSAPTDSPATSLATPARPKAQAVTAPTTEPTPRWNQPLPKAAAQPSRPLPSEMPAPPAPEAQPEPVVQKVARSVPDPATAESTPAADEGLSLRFASDADFLRLIARGDIRVYAFNADAVLALNGAYEFQQAPAPGQVYELMAQTIPTLIADSLTRARQASAGSFNWGITLPPPIKQQISNHLGSASQGELVIDRYGEVHHVAKN